MPTISEPVDEEIRAGRAQSILEYYASGVHGPWTTRAALRILRYDEDEVREMMAQYRTPRSIG